MVMRWVRVMFVLPLPSIACFFTILFWPQLHDCASGSLLFLLKSRKAMGLLLYLEPGYLNVCEANYAQGVRMSATLLILVRNIITNVLLPVPRVVQGLEYSVQYAPGE